MIVDAHLDLSYNALRGRDVLGPAELQTADAEGIPTVGLPNLLAGGVGLICATIFCAPADANQPGYRTAAEGHARGLEHLAWYDQVEKAGKLRLVRQASDLPQDAADGALPALLLLEGADPLAGTDDVARWFAAGLRLVGLAWRRTRFAGGTGAPGPLTTEGRQIVPALDRHGIIHDTSHLAEEAFWDLLGATSGPVIASHSNCRAIVPTDRQLSDDMIRAIADRGGVIGINFFDKFLLPPSEYGRRRATLDDVVRHVRHICDLVGGTTSVGLGTDMDGGLGRDQIPQEIMTAADLPKVADALGRAGFTPPEIDGIVGRNWLRFFDRSLRRSG